ncbi:hypothetical protein Tco_0908696, partial [Tanacetum coccineum]
MSNNVHEDIQYARFRYPPPMLEKADFESWRQRIRLRITLTEGGEGALHLGIPKDIYTLINHFTDAKDIWDNVKMILEGSKFTKLINDMRNIKMTMSRMQLNSKFVNNMLPEWSRFITEVKLNRGLKESNFDQLYAYLKQHEVHANENKMMMERFIQPTNDPLALVSNASVQKYPTQSSESPQSLNQPSIADNFHLDTGSTSTDNLIESLTNTLALLNQSFKAHLPQMNNQLRTSSNARNNATVQDGRVVVQDVRGRVWGCFLQVKHVTNFDDDATTTKTHVMANLTSEEAGPSYDSNTPFE